MNGTDEQHHVEASITFRRVRREDFVLLGRWLGEPHVARWWAHDPSPEAVERDFGPVADGDDPAEDHLVLVDGQPVGLIQFCRFRDEPGYVEEMAEVYPVADDAGSIDYLLGEPVLVGRGLGTRMIRRFVEHVWVAAPDVTHLVVPVNSANVASWRTLIAAGFRLVARGDLEPDNPTDDRGHEVLRIDRPS